MILVRKVIMHAIAVTVVSSLRHEVLLMITGERRVQKMLLLLVHAYFLA